MRTTEARFSLVSRTVQTIRLALATLCALVGLALVGTAPARADLRVCNQSSNEVSIALGYRVAKGWQSEGWWVAPAGQCATLFQGDLTSRFYYVFAADDIGGGAWDGSVYMCTRDESFTIFEVNDCLARGYERNGFFEVDTQNRSDWMLQLTDADNAGAPLADAPDQTVVLDGGTPPPQGDLPPGQDGPMEGDLPPDAADEGTE